MTAATVAMRVPSQDGSKEKSLSSVTKALSLLAACARADGGVSGVSDLATVSDMPRSTAHRLLQALEEQGFVSRAGRKYRVGSRLFELSQAARWSEYGELSQTAAPALEWLFASTGATVQLAVLDGPDVLFLEKITGAGGCTIPTRVGARLPATCSASGKAILAFSPPSVVGGLLRGPLPRPTGYSVAVPGLLLDQLRETRTSGIAGEDDEVKVGVRGVAAPVLLKMRAVAAISIGSTDRDALARHRPALRVAAARIARDLQALTC